MKKKWTSIDQRSRAFALACGMLGAAGCGAKSSEENIGSVTADIVDGVTASAYPEAALIEMSQQGQIKAACSGALVAPRVVLTAGHCVDGFTGWSVKAPFLNQSATATAAETYDWKSDGSDDVIPSAHDVGLVFLDQPITASQYPALADAPLADGSTIVNVGRVDDGALSSDALFVSQPLAVTSAATSGFPFDYATTAVIQPGDSGGPVEVPNATPHTIVAVNSGAGAGAEVLARVDLLSGWIRDRIAAHGGSGAAVAARAPTPPTPAPACSGAAEVEPNDSYQTPTTLAGVVCGSLGGADVQDWYAWSIDGAIPYDVSLSSAGDATVAMWKLVAGGYARVANTSATEISHVASGAGSYVLAVYTPTAAAQSYTLTLTK